MIFIIIKNTNIIMHLQCIDPLIYSLEYVNLRF